MTLDENTLLPAGMVMAGLVALLPMLLKTMRAAVRMEQAQTQQAEDIKAIKADLARLNTQLDKHDRKLDHHGGLLRARRRGDRRDTEQPEQ